MLIQSFVAMKTGTYLHPDHNELLWLFQPPALYERESFDPVSELTSKIWYTLEKLREKNSRFELYFEFGFHLKTVFSFWIWKSYSQPSFSKCGPAHQGSFFRLYLASFMVTYGFMESWKWHRSHNDLICVHSFSVADWNLAAVAEL